MAQTGKNLQNSRVRGRLAESITMSKEKGVMSQFREMTAAENKGKQL